MVKKSFVNWADNNFGWIVASIIVVFICTVTVGIILINKYVEDSRIYEDNQLICYSDNSEDDMPNSHQSFYCVTRVGRVKTCEYDYSRGSGNKPPQGCYL